MSHHWRGVACQLDFLLSPDLMVHLLRKRSVLYIVHVYRYNVHVAKVSIR